MNYQLSTNNSELLIGIGYDCHRIIKNRNLFLGGVKIDANFGLKGHSDADVVLHSICDAILSACGLPDIGELFPDTEDKYKNISSVVIAEKVLEKISRNYKIINIDIVLICDVVKVSKYKEEMKSSLKKIFKTNFVNIKGKTTEGIKSFKEYIQCYSVVLVKKK